MASEWTEVGTIGYEDELVLSIQQRGGFVRLIIADAEGEMSAGLGAGLREQFQKLFMEAERLADAHAAALYEIGAAVAALHEDEPHGCDAHLFGGAPTMLDWKCRCIVCARCGHHTGNANQGHYWAFCKVTGTTREFHMCCPDPEFGCELEKRPKEAEPSRFPAGELVADVECQGTDMSVIQQQYPPEPDDEPEYEDPEVQAMAQVVEALITLDAAIGRRVLRWACERYGVAPAQLPVAQDGRGTSLKTGERAGSNPAGETRRAASRDE